MGRAFNPKEFRYDKQLTIVKDRIFDGGKDKSYVRRIGCLCETRRIRC